MSFKNLIVEGMNMRLPRKNGFNPSFVKPFVEAIFATHAIQRRECYK